MVALSALAGSTIVAVPALLLPLAAAGIRYY
jgi:hypothetical protein